MFLSRVRLVVAGSIIKIVVDVEISRKMAASVILYARIYKIIIITITAAAAEAHCTRNEESKMLKKNDVFVISY